MPWAVSERQPALAQPGAERVRKELSADLLSGYRRWMSWGYAYRRLMSWGYAYPRLMSWGYVCRHCSTSE